MRFPIALPITPGRRALLWLLLAATVILGAGIGVRDPWPADEPRFNLVARQMVESGEYLITHRGIELYSDKPPMYMWTQVGAYAMTGSWRIAFLLPSLLSALGCLWLIYDLSARLWTRRTAWWAAFTLLCCFHFAFQAKRAQIDMVLLGMLMLSLYGFLRHLLRGPDWPAYALGWLAAGLATITKGVGVLAPLVLLPALLAHWRGFHGLQPLPGWRDWRWWVLPLGFLAVVAAWLVPMYLATYGSGDPDKIAYANDLLFRQTAKRYVQSWHHREPFWYFLGVMALAWIPLSLWVPWWGPALWRRVRRRLDARAFVPAVWAALIVLFFSFSPGKRDVYILPALPMLILALAPMLPGLMRRAGPNRAAFVAGLALALPLLLAGAAALFGEPGFEVREEANRGLAADSDALWWILLLSGAAAVTALLAWRPKRGVLGFASTMAVLWFLTVGWGGSAVLNDYTSARGVMQQARRMVGPDITLGLVGWQEQNLVQALPPVANFGFERTDKQGQWVAGQAWLRVAPANRRLFVLEALLDDCVDREQIEYAGISNRRRWYIVPARALRVDCRASPAALQSDADSQDD